MRLNIEDDMGDTSVSFTWGENEWGDRFVTEFNGPDFRDEPAQARYDRDYRPLFETDRCVFVICGTDSGLLPRYVAEHFSDKQSLYVFVEAEDVFDLASQAVEGIQAENVQLSRIEELPQALSSVDLRHYLYRNAVFLVPAASATRETPRYTPLLQRLRKHLDKARFQISATSQGTAFILARLQNLPDHELPLARLDGRFKAAQAVVLGAGPSLDELLPWVREHRQSLVVFAVSRLAKRLLHEDLLPDFVVTIDPSNLSFKVSREMLTFPPDRILVYETHANPKLVAQWPGRKFYAGPRFPWEQREDVNYGTTVSHLAVWAAIRMGFEKIYLAGFDLCYGPGGKVHESASSGKVEGPVARRDVQTVETNEGGQAETDYPFLAGIQGLSTLAHIARQAGGEVVNLAAKAAKVPGVAFVPPDQARPPETVLDALARVNEAAPPWNEADRRKYLQNLRADLNRLLDRCREIRKGIEKGRSVVRRYKGLPPHRQGKAFRELQRITQKLQSKHDELLSLMQQLFPDIFYSHFDTKDLPQTAEERIAHDRSLLEAYRATLPPFERLLRQVKDKTAFRLAELDPESDPEELAQRWMAQSEPGRIRCVPSGVQERIFAGLSDGTRKALEQDLKRLIQAENTPKAAFHPGTVVGRLLDLFRQEDAEGLKRTIDTLRERTEPEAQALIRLAEGMVAEFQKALEEAETAYSEAATSGHASVLEPARRRLARVLLARGKANEAAEVVFRLCTAHPGDAPELAESLAKMGRPDLALRAVAGLLEGNPKAPRLWYAAGLAQEALGEQQGAWQAYQQALALDPEDPRAREGLARLEKPGG